MKTVLLLISILILTSGCDKPPIPAARLVKRAPASNAETGFLVKNLTRSQLINYLHTHPEAKVRVLSEEQGFYEIYNTANFPAGVEILPNEFIHLKQTEPSLLDSGDEFLQDCNVQSGTGPIELKLSHELPVEAGQTITVKAKPEAMSFLFLVKPPPGSLMPNHETQAQGIEITPDQGGDFEITAVGKDQEKNCWLRKLKLRATENPEHDLENAFSTQDKRKLDLKPFWHLQKIGWEAYQKSEKRQGQNTVIAIIDSGVNYNHPALVENFKADNLGKDLIDGDDFPFDDDGHGTHVAALAASSLIGVATKAQLLAVRALHSQGLDLGTVAAGIYYAVNAEVDIINMSVGWHSKADPAEKAVKAAINLAQKKNIIIVAASGNGNGFGIGTSNDEKPMLPASLPNQNIVSVAALDKDNRLAKYSNFGKKTVDIAAPGGSLATELILSAHRKTADGKIWFEREGTSQAAPLVSGALALIKSENPHKTATAIIQHLYANSQNQADLIPKIRTGKRLNLQLLTRP